MYRLTLFFVFLFFLNVYPQSHKDYISGPFDSPQALTQECLNCHQNAAIELMKTNHWTWLDEEYVSEDGNKTRMGKKNFINNFCIAVPSNYPRCTSCHAGYGWKDSSFNFSAPENVDCLVCHDGSGTYVKVPTGAGMPDKKVDLLLVSQSVGKSSRKNCGMCHFDGGGGTGVKHGDLDDSLYEPKPETDVHMGVLDFSCTDCHQTKEHKIMGASHGSMASGQNHIYCTDCHEGEVHENKTINKHLSSVACETCHIPEFAKEEPTKVWWDWSKAGEDRADTKDKYGKETYSRIKGEFVWAKNVIPTYKWYNGSAQYYQFGEIFNPAEVVKLNNLNGSMSDPNSKITPFKVMRGKQIYDSENNYLIIPKLFGEDGYWKTFDWNLASQIGMKEVKLDYSGRYGFVETEMYWPINHMVASKDKALRCTNCHGVKGNYLNWKELGYSGDPMKVKGRKFNN